MNLKGQNSETGQAIVYLVLGLVVFLGFVALAIDGGMALADRRHEQNSADAASLAGGGSAALWLDTEKFVTCNEIWSCENETVEAAEEDAILSAIERAFTNGFTISDGISNSNGVTTSCGPNEITEDKFIDVTVAISATTPSNFLQVIYPKALHNEVEATTRVIPGGPLAFGNAIVALNKEFCSFPGSQGIIMGGNGLINVTGGNIFSNGCIRDNGGPTITIIDGISLGRDPFHITEPNWQPPPIKTDTIIESSEFKIDQPNCDDPSAITRTGKWLEDQLGKNTTYIMEPGLWCITGDLTINQTDDNKNLNDITLLGEGVTIVMLNGKLSISGSPNIQLSAPGVPPGNFDIVKPAKRGLLIYMPASNKEPLTINGNENSLFTGLIFAPGSDIQLNGTGGNTYVNSQVIGYNVTMTGDSDLNLIYNSCNGYIESPSIELYR